MFKVPEDYRVRDGVMASSKTDGANGCFIIPSKIPGRTLQVIASDGMGWEHVSVLGCRGKKTFIPTWDEMCQIKSLFWDDDDTVVQYHPCKEHSINNHPHVLHIWRKIGVEYELPPSVMVGYKDETD